MPISREYVQPETRVLPTSTPLYFIEVMSPLAEFTGREISA
jgi:hypothetical protein